MRKMFLIMLLALILAVMVLTVSAQDQGLYFPETGHYLNEEFRDFFESSGGLELIGYPITDAFNDPISKGLVQYFQNGRIEYTLNPESGQFEARLSPLGEWLHGIDAPQPQPILPIGNTPGCAFYVINQDAKVGFNVCHAFLSFYEAAGGPQKLGLPVSNQTLERGRIVQYFQGYRLDWYPDAPGGGQVKIAPLGRAHFQRANHPLQLLHPVTLDNIRQIEVTHILPRASVWQPIARSSDSQQVFVMVWDQLLRPLEGASVTLVAHFVDGEVTQVMPLTDENGLSQFGLEFDDQPPGSLVTLEFWVAYQGDFLTRTRDSFFIGRD